MVGRCSDGEAATAAKSGTHTNISDHMNNVVTILFQNKADSLFRDQLDLSSINYKKNVGHVLEAVLNAMGTTRPTMCCRGSGGRASAT